MPTQVTSLSSLGLEFRISSTADNSPILPETGDLRKTREPAPESGTPVPLLRPGLRLVPAAGPAPEVAPGHGRVSMPDLRERVFEAGQSPATPEAPPGPEGLRLQPL